VALFLVERPAVTRELRHKAENGIRIRFPFGDPTAREAARRSKGEQLGKGTVAARIRNALAFVRPLTEVPGIEVRLH
ncbi:XRE family transcriptional regulator, partial [Saccharothrix algeriensis]